MEKTTKKIGYVLEGGGLRGMFTAGVLDVLMEHDMTADGVVGVSAGAVFGCNFKSRQIGRTIRYNKRFCADPRYASVRNWIKSRDVYSLDFAYGEVPRTLDPFDSKTFSENPMRFTVVCTDRNSGETVYHDCCKGDEEDIAWMRASAAIPVACTAVCLEGRELQDGGVADAIPVKWMQSQDYDKLVVVLTRPVTYRKTPNKMMPLLKIILKKYPKLLELLANRHERYNKSVEEIIQLEQEGKLFVIRPEFRIDMPIIEKNAEHLEEVYQMGRTQADKQLEELQRFLAE